MTSAPKEDDLDYGSCNFNDQTNNTKRLFSGEEEETCAYVSRVLDHVIFEARAHEVSESKIWTFSGVTVRSISWTSETANGPGPGVATSRSRDRNMRDAIFRMFPKGRLRRS